MNTTLAYAPDQYMIIDNLSIRYRTLGRGIKTLLLIHGLGASLEHWYRLVPLLAEEFKLIILDLPGAGRSDKPKRNYSLDFYTEVLEQFIDQLNLKDIVLVGHSFGGGVALQLAIKKKSVLVAWYY